MEKGKGKATEVEAAPEVLSPLSISEEDNKHLEALSLVVPLPAAGPSRLSHNNHPVGYGDTPVPAEEVDAYAYQPPVKQKQKQKHKKREEPFLLIQFLNLFD
jgi:hypothetical protein